MNDASFGSFQIIHELSDEELRNSVQTQASVHCFKTSGLEIDSSDPDFLEEAVWQKVRRAKTISCLDIALGAWHKGELVFLCFKRGPGESFPGVWCTFGGSIIPGHNSIERTLQYRMHDEGRIDVRPGTLIAYIGTYYTYCDKTGVNTMQPYYFGEVEYQNLLNYSVNSKLQTEAHIFNESDWLKEYSEVTGEEYHGHVLRKLWRVIGRRAC